MEGSVLRVPISKDYRSWEFFLFSEIRKQSIRRVQKIGAKQKFLIKYLKCGKLGVLRNERTKKEEKTVNTGRV